MRGAGTSAHEEYRRRVSRRRRARLAAAGAGLGAAGWGAAAGWGVAPGSGVAAGPVPAVAVLVVAGAALIAAAGFRGFGGADVERWYRGAVGEEATAALLSSLRGRRWSVHHDLAVPGTRANIDHVVIGPTGVWVIDTKTSRAPVRAGWRRVRFGSRPLDTSGCRWQAQVVGDRIGFDGVRPLVVVHAGGFGGASPGRGGRAGGVPVVPADRLLRRLRRRSLRRRPLGRREVEELADALQGALGQRVQPAGPNCGRYGEPVVATLRARPTGRAGRPRD